MNKAAVKYVSIGQSLSLTVAKVENPLIPVEEFGKSDGLTLTDEGLYDFIKERSNT